MTESLYINEQREVRGGVVRRFNIIGTRCVIYEAWELDDAFIGAHQTITHLTIDGATRQYGRVDTRWFKSDLPYMTRERRTAAERHWGRLNARAYAMIREAYPEAAQGRKREGTIEIWLPEGGEA